MTMKQDSLNALFSGLTRANGDTQPQEANEGKENQTPSVGAETTDSQDNQQEQETANESERLCTIVKTDTIQKIRAIAQLEGLPIKDVIEAAFSKAIEAYESKNGVIEYTRKNPKDLF